MLHSDVVTLTLLLQGMATSMFFSGVLVLQKAITEMFTYEASVTGCR